MTEHRAPITAYINADVIRIMSEPFPPDKGRGEEWQAMKNIWGYFQDDRLRLVTSADDTEIDIILWLNRQGCCVSDTLMALEAIEHFEEWGRATGEETEKFKRLIEFFEQVESLPEGTGGYDEVTSEGDVKLAEILRRHIFSIDQERNEYDASLDETRSLMRECLQNLGRWYREEQWHDLRRTEYETNWAILSSVLESRGEKAVFDGEGGQRTRSLFGLLNRAVGLSKKSSPGTAMSDGHIDFVVSTVMKKYAGHQQERDVCHVFHCIRHNIAFFITTDSNLIDRFERKGHHLQEHPLFTSARLTLLRPTEFERHLSR
jgi:hypothetical protein